MGSFAAVDHRKDVITVKRPVVVWGELGGPRTLQPGERFLLMAKRASSLGGYIATIAEMSTDQFLGEYATPLSKSYQLHSDNLMAAPA